MYSKFWPKGGLPGILHHFTETLVTFEYTSSTVRKPHSILFVGGLGDGLATTSYTADLVRALQPTEWSLFTLTLTSAYQSWGLGHLDRDTDEIAECIRYIKEYKKEKFGDGKLVLMGHSTGSQCVIHYLSQPNPHTSKPAFDPYLEHVKRSPLDGAIMQAPVSDREAILWVLAHGFGDKTPAEMKPVFEKMLALAKEADSKKSEYDIILPLELTSQIYPSNTPISARRFLSLVSPDSPESPGEDDLFSSDLSDEQLGKTFGAIQKGGLLKSKLMVLISGADQSVPDWVDKENLLVRWRKATDHNGEFQIWDQVHTGVIPNASHALSNDDQAEPRKFLVGRVLGYLQAREREP
ncbi:putative siderophore biosynthesis lipase/esterase [Xylariales sp. PMI_506]|nr:putative siderophore biosynthesis lipase/esterase [Xylariales sp. PMI_506]